MKRTLIAALTVASTTGLTFVGVPGAHAADASIRSITIAPSTAVQTGVTKQKIRFTVSTTGAVRVRAKVTDSAGENSMFVDDLTQTATGVWKGVGEVYNFDPAGTYTVKIGAFDSESDEVERSTTFKVRRGTYFQGFKAAPKSVRKGRAITVSGRLKGISGGKYAAYRYGKIRIYFQKKNTRTWTYKAGLTTSKTGTFSRRFSASTSGTWQVRFAGAGLYHPSSAAYYVRVK